MPERAPDLEALSALHHASFTTPRPWSADEIAAAIAPKHAFLLQTEACGFLIGTALAGEAEVITLAVAPQARRQGLGAQLLARFLREAQARGAETAYLEVAADNEAACALYERAGFQTVGQRRGYYHTPDGARIDARVMARPLADLGPLAP